MTHFVMYSRVSFHYNPGEPSVSPCPCAHSAALHLTPQSMASCAASASGVPRSILFLRESSLVMSGQGAWLGPPCGVKRVTLELCHQLTS